MTRLARLVAGLALSGLSVTVLGALAGCTADEPRTDPEVSTGSFQLVAFDGCDDALQGLRAAAKDAVGPYGFGNSALAKDTVGIPPQAGAPNAATDQRSGAGTGAAAQAAPNYSGTNTAEAGVDEPDLVKTDGRRIVTVAGGTLRVVDAGRKTIIGSVPLTGPGAINPASFAYQPADLLLAGDRALVLLNQQYLADTDLRAGADFRGPFPSMGPRLLLVDIAGAPRVLSVAEVDGSLLDARQVGPTVRVVVRSSPRIPFDIAANKPQADLVAANRARIDQTPIDAWLPKVRVTTGGVTRPMAVECGAISRPAVYSATNLLTILTYDLGAPSLDDGKPSTLVADGETVYSNGTSLYVTNDQRWRLQGPLAGSGPARTVDTGHTEIYQFDTSTRDSARFVAGGSVPGLLLNQYSMSEWDGKLRVATTTDRGRGGASQSGVYVLTRRGDALRVVGAVEGLGQGERIYAVRFAGPVGYVVTFRQTDPLYTVDLSDPLHPAVRGALKITGYSSYLHPAGGSRVIGIGQEATDQGRVTGTQVSLFDVANLTAPARLAQYALPATRSEAEFDPHAFLYWPESGLLVVPLQSARGAGGFGTGALVLRINGDTIREVGFINQPDAVRRSLIIDQTLWTVSNTGLLASDAQTLQRLAWVPFN